ncbi:MAG: hypothetical protein ACFE95_22410 [Candidatus Hodarchaeota archaeon]
MVLKDLLTVDLASQKDLDELKEYLDLPNFFSECELVSTWRVIRHMSSVLELPLDTPIKDLVELYKKLKEIQQVFNLQNPNFIQLNVLYVELTTVREMLNLPETISIAEVVDRVKHEVLPTLGIGDNSLLEKVLKLKKA